MSESRYVGVRRLRALLLLAAAFGSVLPSLASLKDFSPPFLHKAWLITALAAVVGTMAFILPRRWPMNNEKIKKDLRRATALVAVSFSLALSYIPFYYLTTVAAPMPPPTVPCQAGFGLSFLTTSARDFAKWHPEQANPEGLMMAYAAFAECRTYRIWEKWSISAAGLSLALLFSASSLSWALGFSWLARLLPHPSKGRAPKKALVSLLALLALSSCAVEPFTSAHVTASERIKHLEAKVKKLDEKSAAKKLPASTQ
jgi:hypothetical protein